MHLLKSSLKILTHIHEIPNILPSLSPAFHQQILTYSDLQLFSKH